MEVLDIEKEAAAIADGIYFDLNEDVYHAVKRFSSSGAKDMAVSPATYWKNSHLNTTPEFRTPKQIEAAERARILGRAYHCARLEPRKFAETYIRKITKADFADVEGALFTGDQIDEELLNRELKKSGSVMDRAKRLSENGYDKPIWHIEEAKWAEGSAGKIALDGSDYDQIELDMHRISKNPEIVDRLTNGFPEVSVFWTDERGIQCKARFDFLQAGDFSDFKTFANSLRKGLDKCLADAVAYDRIYLQMVFYWEAAEAIRAGGLTIMGAPSIEQIELIDDIKANPAPLQPWLIFQEKGGVPNILARQFETHYLPTDHVVNSAGLDPAKKAEVDAWRSKETLIFTKGRFEINKAKANLIRYSEMYPEGEEWFPADMIGTIGDGDFSTYFLEN